MPLRLGRHFSVKAGFTKLNENKIQLLENPDNPTIKVKVFFKQNI